LIKCHFVRYAICLSGIIVFVYLIFMFVSGEYLNEQLNGTWVSECGRSRYTFDGDEFTHNTRGCGVFKIRGNQIIFLETGYSYHIRVTRTYMILDGVFYLLT
jgi:hypothetical protein